MKLVVLAGGTGSAKLLRGLRSEAGRFTVISNVGDNFWHRGLYICPDVDIAMYTLAGVADEVKGWGINGDTFAALEQMRRLGEDAWFTLGDRDLATHIIRTELISKGERLGDVTTSLCRKFGVTQKLLPCTDDRLETYIETDLGTMHLQEFWVRNRGEPEVEGVEYRGAEGARPEKDVLAEIEGADRIVFCPANPVTSIMPILAVDEIRKAIARSRARRVAVSPVIGGSPVSGPAGKMMRAIGVEPTVPSVAKLYAGLVESLLIDPQDASLSGQVERNGMRAVPASILMRGHEDERSLARSVLEA